MGKELEKEYYDTVFSNGGHNKTYFKNAKDIKQYYPSWKMAYDFIINNKIKKIVDLGCGPGHFPTLFSNQDNIEYVGYDFSEVAIEQAKKRNNNKKINFFVKNLKDLTSIEDSNFYVSFEFLEHVTFDLEILNLLKINDEIIFSVPNYDSAGHVRFFKNESEIENRYGKILKLNKLNNNYNGGNIIYLYHGIKK